MNSKPKSLDKASSRSGARINQLQPKLARTTPDGKVRLFKDQAAWSGWLDKNHARSSGIWLRLAKKNSGLKSVTYAEALEVALCYGWIDGHKRPERRASLAAAILSALGEKHLVEDQSREGARPHRKRAA